MEVEVLPSAPSLLSHIARVVLVNVYPQRAEPWAHQELSKPQSGVQVVIFRRDCVLANTPRGLFPQGLPSHITFEISFPGQSGF